jgi:hypothetical protein
MASHGVPIAIGMAWPSLCYEMLLSHSIGLGSPQAANPTIQPARLRDDDELGRLHSIEMP